MLAPHLTTLLLALGLPLAWAVPTVTSRTCGTGDPPPALQAVAAQFAQQASGIQPLAAHAPIVVSTYAHVVTTSTKQGRYSQTQINNQITYMNNAYGSHGITFSLKSTDFTVNNNWATGNYDSQMKPALRKGTYSSLNLYFLSDLSGGLLGICNFPTNAAPGSSAYNQDGCDVLADSLPGGSATNYNLGGTAAHETGHWFGLFHVFQGQSCSGSGDSVSDTPIQKVATSGCPSSQDSCPNSAGLDNIHNYMDYSYE